MKKFFLILICCMTVFSSCGKKKVDIEEEKDIHSDGLSAVEEDESLEGKGANPLTGLYIDESIAQRRPVAVMINNLHKALPQSGIGQADLLYEALAEGEITRMVAVFQDFDAEKIGPVRSARDYFTYFALDNDAFYIHHGGSPSGYAAIKNRDVDNIDGMTSGAVFWRDKSRANQPGMYEHSSYTSANKILKGCNDRKYRMEKDKDFVPMFCFNDDEEIFSECDNATNVIIPYSSYQVSQFVYNSEKMQYERYQSGEPQIDELTGEPVNVKNVIIQFADIQVIDNEGRRNIELVGSGSGKYISNGKAMDLTWSKEKYYTPTKWFDINGNELSINKGKTWICVCPLDLAITVE